MQGLAREIIFAIGDNMEEGLEPLLTKTLAPSLYQVYLHRDDFDRLRTIFAQIESEARVHLDQKLSALENRPRPLERPARLLANARVLPKRLRTAAEPTERPPAMRFEPAAGEWHIRFQEDPDDSLEPGEVEVVSELAVGELVEYGAGSPTERIKISTTRRLGTSTSERSAKPVAVPPPPDSELPTAPVMPTPIASQGTDSVEGDVVAEIEYEEDGQSHTFALLSNRNEFVIGRGAVDVWVDLRLQAPADVSRRHVLIRRDDERRFWIEDLSQFGTWVDGGRIPQSTPTELRHGATIDLAAVAKLRFRIEQPALPPIPLPPPVPANS
ncbi:MAG: FHA domain-containing protein [Acidobacteriota bacterium]